MNDEEVRVTWPSVHEAIAIIKAEIGAVGRGGEMKQGEKYNYRKSDDVIAASQPLEAKYGVVMAPHVHELRVEMRTTRSNNPIEYVHMLVDWIITGADGSVYEVAGVLPRTVGEASDMSDKACNKAQTAAQKVLLCQLYNIPYSQPDPDDDRTEMGHQARPERPQLPDGHLSVKDAKNELLELLGDTEKAGAYWRSWWPQPGPTESVSRVDLDEMLADVKSSEAGKS